MELGPEIGGRTVSGRFTLAARARRLRRVSSFVHRCSSLVLGLPLVLIGLSGSALVFRALADGALNPELTHPRTHAVPGRPQGLDALLERARTAAPSGALARSLDLVTSDHAVLTVQFEEPSAHGSRWYEVAFDPQTRVLLGARPTWGATSFGPRTLFYALYELHVSLFCGPLGTQLVGILAFGLCLTVSSGAYLAWARTRSLTGLFRLMKTANAARRNYDLHRVAGAFGGGVLFVLGCTGAYFIYPEVFLAPLRPLSRTTQPPAARPGPGPARIRIDDAIARCAQQHGNAALLSVTLPSAEDRVYVLHWDAGPNRTLRSSVDAHTGEVIQHASPSTFADAFDSWQFPIHSGQAFGWIGRGLVCCAGLLPLWLWITGYRHFRRTARARRRGHADP